MPNSAFHFAEAEVWVKPVGLNSVSVGFVRSYNLERTPVLVEDGAAAFFQDRLTIESPWVDSDVTTIFYARGAYDFIVVKWLNEDDGRLESASITKAICRSAGRRPGQGEVETFTFQFEAVSQA